MKNIITTTIALLAFIAYAQPGNIDITFNPNDVGFGDGIGANNSVWTTSVQNDGKIIIGGTFNSYNRITINRIARINTDGTIDTSFNPGTGANNIIYASSIQSDGKIIIGGDFTSYNGVNSNYIARLNIDGTLDTTFNSGTGADSSVRSISIQSDGKIIIGGYFTSYNGTPRNYIARLNTNGIIDSTFNPSMGPDNIVETTSIQSDGKIIIGGNFAFYNGTSRNGIARLNADGTIDSIFNPGTGANGGVMTISIQSNGQLIIGGNFTAYNGITKNRVARLNTNGTIDTAFNTGTGANNTVWTTSIQSDGKIIIGGDFTSYFGGTPYHIARLNTNGGLDAFVGASMDSGGVYTTSIQSDGKIIIAGSFASTTSTLINNRIIRLNTDGSYDSNFASTTGANDKVKTTAIQSDGKIIIGGDFFTYNGIARSKIARLNSVGTLDLSFNPGTGVTATASSGSVNTIAIQNDGKIIIGGFFNYYNGIARNYIARINTDGTIDTSFNLGTGANARVYNINIQIDGKIIIGGSFTSFNGITRNKIARLNTDGTIDTSFNPGTGTDNIIQTTSIQSDGKIIIGGDFTSYNGISRNRIARLNTNGTIDISFDPGTGADRVVMTTSIQSDGKVIIGGGFGRYNGTIRNFIARLNVNGSLDSTFNFVTSANNWEGYTTSIQSDGKVIIGGNFTISGINRIARLNTDGTLDTSFISGTGPSTSIYPASIYTTSVTNDGKIIIGGDFTMYNGIGRNRIARINGNNQLNTSDFEKNNIVIYPNPCTGVFNLHIIDISGVKKIDVFTLLGQKIFSKDITDKETSINISNQPKGVYLYKVFNENDYVKSGKLILE